MMASGNNTGLLERPMNVEQIVKLAGDQALDTQFSMQHYFRAADLLVKQANIYEQEGNDQKAYFYLYRHANLITIDLPTHPHAQDAKYKQPWINARKSASKSLTILETLNPKINKRYKEYVDRRKARTAQAEESRQHRGRASFDPHELHLQDGTDGTQNRLDPAQHRDMAVQFANEEIRLKSQRRRKQPTFEQLGNSRGMKDLDTKMIDARRQVDQSRTSPMSPTSPEQRTAGATYDYPSVPRASQPETSRRLSNGDRRLPTFTSIKTQPQQQQLQLQPPQKPPKSPTLRAATHQTSKPPIPSKVVSSPPPPPPEKIAPSPPPSPQTNHEFLPSAYLENGTPLRTIFFPAPLRHHFVRIASRNTTLNLETCGVLCGTLLRNAFFITKLVIPEQISTSDTCEMVNEVALHEYCDAQPEEMMVLGWIHTHPTQTAFMSSRDLHTHCWYQVQLPESIAIVCAPSQKPDFGVFRITDPPGMSAIRSCKQTGIFHPHQETHLFTDALGRPGHVIEHEDLQFETVDLRP